MNFLMVVLSQPDSFDMSPPHCGDTKLFMQLTYKRLLRLLTRLDMTAEDIPDIGIKSSRGRA
jgi:hypothetical protein